MAYNFINIISAFIVYLGTYYIKTGSFHTTGSYTNLFYYYLTINIVFSLYYKPKANYFKDRAFSILVEFLVILSSLTLATSLGSLGEVSRIYLFNIAFLIVLIRWISGFYFNDTGISLKKCEDEVLILILKDLLLVT